MLSENDLRELVEFSAQAPVLSLYLSTDPTEGNADTHKLRVRSMLKEIPLPQDVEAIHRYLNHEYNWQGRAVALFSCAPAGFFRVYPLAVPVRNLVHIGDRPSVKPLANLLDNYGGYGVILVDKQGARVFYYHLGTLLEQEGVVGEMVRHTKGGGSSSVPGRRGGVAGTNRLEDELVERNMRDSAAFCTHFFEEKHVRRILIGGSDDNTSMFKSYLPKSMQSLVLGSFPMSMTASHLEVQSRAMQVGLEAETHKEAALVDTLITAAAKGSGAVVGLSAVLGAVNENRVMTLVVADEFRKTGFRTKDTGQLMEALPPDGEEDAEKVFDVVDLAVNVVMRGGGDVEVVYQNDALIKAGSIGALLRY